MRRIGLISDTHGLLRPQVVQFLEGCEHIIHAGDICDAAILDRLERLPNWHFFYDRQRARINAIARSAGPSSANGPR